MYINQNSILKKKTYGRSLNLEVPIDFIIVLF